jgi:hypothetical protein
MSVQSTHSQSELFRIDASAKKSGRVFLGAGHSGMALTPHVPE